MEIRSFGDATVGIEVAESPSENAATLRTVEEQRQKIWRLKAIIHQERRRTAREKNWDTTPAPALSSSDAALEGSLGNRFVRDVVFLAHEPAGLLLKAPGHEKKLLFAGAVSSFQAEIQLGFGLGLGFDPPSRQSSSVPMFWLPCSLLSVTPAVRPARS